MNSFPGITGNHRISRRLGFQTEPNSYGREKLVEGFRFLSGPQAFFDLPAYSTVDIVLRIEFYTSMYFVFRDLFIHDSLETSAYLWFESILVWCVNSLGESVLDEPRLRKEILKIEEQVLAIKSLHCQEAALHGLAYIEAEEPDSVRRIVTKFLKQPCLDPSIRLKAMHLRSC